MPQSAGALNPENGSRNCGVNAPRTSNPARFFLQARLENALDNCATPEGYLEKCVEYLEFYQTEGMPKFVSLPLKLNILSSPELEKKELLVDFCWKYLNQARNPLQAMYDLFRHRLGAWEPRLYIKYAELLENVGDFDEAEKVLSRGIAPPYCLQLKDALQQLQSKPTTKKHATKGVPMVDMNLVYRVIDGVEEELSLEEIMLHARRLMDANYPKRPKPDRNGPKIGYPPVVHAISESTPTRATHYARSKLNDYLRGFSDETVQWRNNNDATQQVYPNFTPDMQFAAQQYSQSPRVNQTPYTANTPLPTRPPFREGPGPTGLGLASPPQPTSDPSQVLAKIPKLNRFPPDESIVGPPQGEPPSFPDVVDASTLETRMKLMPFVEPLLRQTQIYYRYNFPYAKLGGVNGLRRARLPADLRLGNTAFKLTAKLGQGGYGTVWKAHLFDDPSKTEYAVKGEQSKIPWELYTILAARSRIKNSRVLDSLVRIYHYEGFADEQFLVMPMYRRGNLLDVARHLQKESPGEAYVEIVAMFYAVEMLRVIEGLHSARIIHGDVKAENFMIRSTDPPQLPYGDMQWSAQGLVALDFGRAIDMRLFDRKQQFEAGWPFCEEQDCWEMRENLPWTYQTDYYGVAGVVHLLLFHKYIDVDVEDGRRVLESPFKRQWHAHIWQQFFRLLLNPGPKLPICRGLSDLLGAIENYLVANGQRVQQILSDLMKNL